MIDSLCARTVFVWMLAGVVACAGEGTAPPDGDGNGEVSFSNDVQPIFTASCALSNCHAGASPRQGMNLSAGLAYDNIVNVPSVDVPGLDRIEPGEPDSSYLVHKIQGTQGQVGGVGDRMPLINCCLSAEQIGTIRTWVEQGAPRN